MSRSIVRLSPQEALARRRALHEKEQRRAKLYALFRECSLCAVGGTLAGHILSCLVMVPAAAAAATAVAGKAIFMHGPVTMALVSAGVGAATSSSIYMWRRPKLNGVARRWNKAVSLACLMAMAGYNYHHNIIEMDAQLARVWEQYKSLPPEQQAVYETAARKLGLPVKDYFREIGCVTLPLPVRPTQKVERVKGMVTLRSTAPAA